MTRAVHELAEDRTWCEEVFKYADWDIQDVQAVVFALDGENEGDDWLGAFLLRDDRFGVVRAGCDYTGWG